MHVGAKGGWEVRRMRRFCRQADVSSAGSEPLEGGRREQAHALAVAALSGLAKLTTYLLSSSTGFPPFVQFMLRLEI